MATRRRLGETSGCDETRLHSDHMYTDDSWAAALGVIGILDTMRAWDWTVLKLRLIMAIALKQRVGTCAVLGKSH